MESANRREVVAQRCAVAPFECVTELLNRLTGDLFCLLYSWLFSCSGSFLSPSPPLSEGARSRNRGQERRDWRIQVGAVARLDEPLLGGRQYSMSKLVIAIRNYVTLGFCCGRRKGSALAAGLQTEGVGCTLQREGGFCQSGSKRP